MQEKSKSEHFRPADEEAILALETELERTWVLQLYKEWQELQRYYRLPTLPTPLITLHMGRQRYGFYDPLERRLSLSVWLIREQNWDVVLEIFKHELAHMLAISLGGESERAHGPLFQEACARLGVAPWARQAYIEIDPSTAMQQHRQLSAEQERCLRRVEKLLSLAGSAESHEATLAMEKARQLCARHQLESILQGEATRYTYILISHKKKVMPAHQAAISSILCTHFYVDCVSRSQFDAQSLESYKVLEILGSQENVQMAEYVYWFLWHQLPLLWAKHREERSGARSGSRSSQRSFYLGVLNGFHEKLSQQKRHLHELSGGWGLTLSRQRSLELEQGAQRELRQFVRERYPHLHRGSGQRSGLIYSDYAKGQERGKNLNLHRGLTQNHRGAIQLLPSAKGKNA